MEANGRRRRAVRVRTWSARARDQHRRWLPPWSPDRRDACGTGSGRVAGGLGVGMAQGICMEDRSIEAVARVEVAKATGRRRPRRPACRGHLNVRARAMRCSAFRWQPHHEQILADVDLLESRGAPTGAGGSSSTRLARIGGLQRVEDEDEGVRGQLGRVGAWIAGFVTSAKLRKPCGWPGRRHLTNEAPSATRSCGRPL